MESHGIQQRKQNRFNKLEDKQFVNEELNEYNKARTGCSQLETVIQSVRDAWSGKEEGERMRGPGESHQKANVGGKNESVDFTLKLQGKNMCM